MEKNKASGDQPHVLVVPYPAQGHINPMLQFSKRLVSKGVRATLALTVYLHKSMHMEPVGPINIQTISDGYDEGGSDDVPFEIRLMKLRAVSSMTLQSLILRLEESGTPVDAVIYDGFLPWVLDVAKELGKLGVVFFTQTCAVNNIYYHVKKGFLELPLKGGPVLVPGLPQLDPVETPSFIHDIGAYPAVYDLVVDQFENVESADYVLFSTFYELEKEVLDWMSANLWPAKTIGPTLPSKYLDKRLEDDRDYALNLYKPNNETCARWLRRKPPCSVVYVSFGSMAELSKEQMFEVAAALSQNRHRFSFLWIVREPEMPKLPPEFLSMFSCEDEAGLILPWCSQLEVLKNDSIGCFLTHCGLNSVMEAVCLGVPLVAVPQWTDQTTNAKYVEDIWGIGLRAKPGKNGHSGREALGLCMEEIMVGDKGKVIRENAKKWKNLAIEAMDEGGSSDRNIDEFVSKLSMLHCTP